nr:MAG TPA: hypothetical protein [Caudoviricetes sp.]
MKNIFFIRGVIFLPYYTLSIIFCKYLTSVFHLLLHFLLHLS